MLYKELGCCEHKTTGESQASSADPSIVCFPREAPHVRELMPRQIMHRHFPLSGEGRLAYEVIDSLMSTLNSCCRNKRSILPDRSVAWFCVHSWIQASICSLSMYSARSTSEGRTAMGMPHLWLSQDRNSCSWRWRPRDIKEF